MNYRLCTLDVDANNEVNDARATSDIIELPEPFTRLDVHKALCSVERMSEDFDPKNILIEEDGDDYYISNRQTGKKVYLLQAQK